MSSGGIHLPQASGLTPASNPDDISPIRPLADPVPAPKTERSRPLVTQPVRSQVARFLARNIPPILPGGSPVEAKLSSRRACTYLYRQTDRLRSIRGSQTGSPARQTSVDSSMPRIVQKIPRDIQHNISKICFFSRIYMYMLHVIVRLGDSDLALGRSHPSSSAPTSDASPTSSTIGNCRLI